MQHISQLSKHSWWLIGKKITKKKEEEEKKKKKKKGTIWGLRKALKQRNSREECLSVTPEQQAHNSHQNITAHARSGML